MIHKFNKLIKGEISISVCGSGRRGGRADGWASQGTSNIGIIHPNLRNNKKKKKKKKKKLKKKKLKTLLKTLLQ